MTEDDNERKEKIRELYRYDTMSNQVLHVDRSLMENKTNAYKDAEISQPKSMLGKITMQEMGSAIKANHVPDSERINAEKEFEKRIKQEERVDSTRRKGKVGTLKELNTLSYQPTDEKNTEIYEQVVIWCSNMLGDDIPHPVLLDATDLIIEILKKDEGADLETKRITIQEGLDTSVEMKEFNKVVTLVSSINDYERTEYHRKSRDDIAIVNSDGDEDEEVVENPLLEQLEEETEEITDEGNWEERAEGRVVENGIASEINTDHELLQDSDIIEVPGAVKELKKISITEVDHLFLIRLLRSNLKSIDETRLHQIHDKILECISTNMDEEKVEILLAEILGKELSSLCKFIARNCEVLRWGNKLASVDSNEVDTIIEEMKREGMTDLAEQYHIFSVSKKRRHSSPEILDNKKQKYSESQGSPKDLNLEDLKFYEGNRLFTATKISLPENSFKRLKQSYEEIHIPAPDKCKDDYKLIEVTDLPLWTRSVFPASETKTLNRVQSEVFPSAFEKDINILLCAPTGAGKTNVAMLSILRALSHYYDEENNKLNLKKIKIVYIAPLKALVQEQVREFQRRLHHLGIKVAELTGDSNLTKQQISETQILVATPEKWDVITRKKDKNSFEKHVRLIIIDEVHLLHDERGPVLESIVARVLADVNRQTPIRLVALSATLPNFLDVAQFLKVPEDGLFYFDSSFRPCPLAQQFCGITEKNALKKKNAMNQACYDKLLEATNDGHQVIVFVHSRKDTARTARWLIKKLVEDEKIGFVTKSDAGSKEILKQESGRVDNKSLSEFLINGFGIHHAGLSRGDRTLSEDLFADGLLSVLVSTATLAWGVNLPAHTVIIKGTEVYSPEKGDWTYLSPQDVLQMLGRAGRPRYDTNGEGIIITNQEDVRYYLAVLNQQLSIESQLISKVVDSVNAEVVLGTVKSRKDGISWLGLTYLFVRMQKSPELYHIQKDFKEKDPILLKHRENIIHSVFQVLHKNSLVIYDPNSGGVKSTELGRIASHYYINYSSIARYNSKVSATSSIMDVFRAFSMSDEFKYINVRQEEVSEVSKLIERAPIPIKEKESDPLAKINVLLQAYISRLKLDGFALNSDMIYITQNGGRLFRALFEICMRKKWPRLAKMLLNICKCVEKRMWTTNTPFRQFKRCPSEVIKRAEASNLPWNDYLSLSNPVEVGEALRSPKYGKTAFDLLQRFPRFGLACTIQPITPTLLRFELEVRPHWIWDTSLSERAESFITMVEDTDGEKILYNGDFTLRMDDHNEAHILDFVIFLPQPLLPPNYFISILSEKWINCEYKIPVLFNNVILPKQFPAPMPLNKELSLTLDSLQIEEFISVFEIGKFNSFQSNVFSPLFETSENILVAASKGSGKTIMAELALLNHWKEGKGRAIYICPSQEKITRLLASWRKRFSDLIGGKIINRLTDELSSNVKLLAQSHLLLATPEQFEHISRRWRQRKNIQKIELMIMDDIHQVANSIRGSTYEMLVTRMLFVSTQLELPIRYVGLSSSLANARDFGEWMGVSKQNIFNFSADEREVGLKIFLDSQDFIEDPSRNPEFLSSVFEQLDSFSASDATCSIFIENRKRALNIASELINISILRGFDLLRTEESSLGSYLRKVKDPQVNRLIKSGIGLLYEGMESSDKEMVLRLYDYKVLTVLIITKNSCYEAPSSNCVFIPSTHFYDHIENRQVDLTIDEILEMVGTAIPDSTRKPGIVRINTTSHKRDYIKKFLKEGMPTESFLPYQTLDLLSNEIGNSVIHTKQDCIDYLTYSYLYRRIHANPSFYGLKEVSGEEISVFLTDLVEDSLKVMSESHMIEISENSETTDQQAIENINPLNACLLGTYTPVSATTLCLFNKSISSSTRLRGLLEILSRSAEFQHLSVRQEDPKILERIHEIAPLKYGSNIDTKSASFKVFVLLQAHFSRLLLPPDLKIDLNEILKVAPMLVSSLVDILSANGYLNATTAMDLSQMVVQGVWDTDSSLKQVPYFNEEILKNCADAKLESIYDIMALEDEERERIITLPEKQLTKVAQFVNSYPNIELKYSIDLSTPVKANEPRTIEITIIRDEEPDSLSVVSDALNHSKTENWWLFIGEQSKKQLFTIKKVCLNQIEQVYDLSIEIEEPGEHVISIWCVCDSYLDADKEVSFTIEVGL